MNVMSFILCICHTLLLRVPAMSPMSATPCVCCVPHVFYTMCLLCPPCLLHHVSVVSPMSATPCVCCVPHVCYTMCLLCPPCLLHHVSVVSPMSATPCVCCVPHVCYTICLLCPPCLLHLVILYGSTLQLKSTYHCNIYCVYSYMLFSYMQTFPGVVNLLR